MHRLWIVASFFLLVSAVFTSAAVVAEEQFKDAVQGYDYNNLLTNERNPTLRRYYKSVLTGTPATRASVGALGVGRSGVDVAEEKLRLVRSLNELGNELNEVLQDFGGASQLTIIKYSYRVIPTFAKIGIIVSSLLKGDVQSVPFQMMMINADVEIMMEIIAPELSRQWRDVGKHVIQSGVQLSEAFQSAFKVVYEKVTSKAVAIKDKVIGWFKPTPTTTATVTVTQATTTTTVVATQTTGV